jgi:hypothetical protein
MIYSRTAADALRTWRATSGEEAHVPTALIGRTIVAIEGAKPESEAILFVCGDGAKFRMYHQQDCCESVLVEDIHGEVEDLLGEPVLYAYESENDQRPGDLTAPEYEPESQTWTFYRLGTRSGGGVVIRWLGTSNGYYSESVTSTATSGEPSPSGNTATARGEHPPFLGLRVAEAA